MCTVSMVGDHYRDAWQERPWYTTVVHPIVPPADSTMTLTLVSRTEFDALKKEVENMKALLIRAKAYDAANNEPDCEMDEKMQVLLKVAAWVGVDISEVVAAPKKA